MREVVIASYLRTAQSRARPKEPARDWFSELRADDLLGKLLPELLHRAGVSPQEVDDCITGCAQPVGEQWGYGGRLPVFLANLPSTVAAKSIDQQCGSALASVQIGFMEIAMGYADVVIAAGMEHMTRVPMGNDLIRTNEALVREDRYRHWDYERATNMGLAAEQLFQASGLTKTDMDQWAVRSHQRAATAQRQEFFQGEIMPLSAKQADGTTRRIDQDQAVRPDTSLETLSTLKPAYTEQGTITAASSSPLSAGAASLLLMSKEAALAKGVQPLATIRAIGFAGVEPILMGSGPVPASRKALKAAGLNAQDIDYWEINEAFCIVPLYCIQQLGIDSNRVNVMGGGVAIGHPLGATGVRLVGTLARILKAKNGRYGVATACVGGGQGVAIVIERY